MRGLKLVMVIGWMFASCSSSEEDVTGTTDPVDPHPIIKQAVDPEVEAFEQLLRDAGMENIKEAIPELDIKIVYSTHDNLVDQPLYPEGFEKAFGHPETIRKLKKAYEILQETHPGYSFRIWDVARPFSVQEKLWDVVKGTGLEPYVAEPIITRAGLHNYGCAVDCTLIDSTGMEVDMGTDFDHFGPESQNRNLWGMVEQGRLSAEHIENRMLLKRVMKSAGFIPILTEWWHFNTVNKYYARENYTLIK